MVIATTSSFSTAIATETPYYWATSTFNETIPQPSSPKLYYPGDLTKSVRRFNEQPEGEIYTTKLSPTGQCIFDLLLKYGMLLDGTDLEWVLQQGTLLSAIRHAGINSIDYDADIGVYYGNKRDYQTMETAVNKKMPKSLHYSFMIPCHPRPKKSIHLDAIGLVTNWKNESLVDSLTSQDIYHNIPFVSPSEGGNVYTRKHSGQRYTIPREWIFPRVQCLFQGLIFPCYHKSIAVLQQLYGSATIEIVRERKPGTKCHRDDEASHDSCYKTKVMDEDSLYRVRCAHRLGFSTLLDLPSLAFGALYPNTTMGAKPFGPLVFMHLRKSGGSTVRGLLRDHQEAGAYEIQTEVEKWVQRPDENRKVVKITHESVDSFSITQPCYRCFFGISREPVARLISLYNYRLCMEQIPKKISFMYWVKRLWRKDLLVNQIAGNDNASTGKERLALAKKRIQKQFFTFGILEEWDDSLRMFRLLRPDYFPSLKYRRVNTHKHMNSQWNNMDEDNKRIIEDILQWDIKFHAWLVERFHQQRTRLKQAGLWSLHKVSIVNSSQNRNAVPHYLVNENKLLKCDASYEPSNVVLKPHFYNQDGHHVVKRLHKQPLSQYILTDDTVGEFMMLKELEEEENDEASYLCA
ncbi:MAG: hypothetical protein ACTSUE_05685 [Promethearchaeota archaeon]